MKDNDEYENGNRNKDADYFHHLDKTNTIDV